MSSDVIQPDLNKSSSTDKSRGKFKLKFVTDPLIVETVNNELKVVDSLEKRTHYTISGRGNTVYQVAFAPQSGVVALATGSDSILIYRFDTGEVIRELKGHTGPVYSVSFSGDGSLVASGGADKSVRLWDTYSGELLHSFKGHSKAVYAVEFSEKYNLLASAGFDKSIMVWGLDEGSLRGVLSGHRYKITDLEFSGSGRFLASSGFDNEVRIWDMISFTEHSLLSGHKSVAYAIAFSPDEKSIASCGWDHTVRIWEVDGGISRKVIQNDGGSIYSVRFSSNGDKLLYGDVKGHLVSYDILDDRQTIVLSDHGSAILSIEVSPDNNWISTAGSDRVAYVYPALYIGLIEELKMLDPALHFAGFHSEYESLIAARDRRDNIKLLKISGDIRGLVLRLPDSSGNRGMMRNRTDISMKEKQIGGHDEENDVVVSQLGKLSNQLVESGSNPALSTRSHLGGKSGINPALSTRSHLGGKSGINPALWRRIETITKSGINPALWRRIETITKSGSNAVDAVHSVRYSQTNGIIELSSKDDESSPVGYNARVKGPDKDNNVVEMLIVSIVLLLSIVNFWLRHRYNSTRASS